MPKKILEGYLRAVSLFSKEDMEKSKEQFIWKDKTGQDFKTFTKTGLNAINAPAGTGKSLVLTEIAFYLLHTEQIERVIWLDLDNNYTTLKKREQAQFINDFGDAFLLLTDQKLLEQARYAQQVIKEKKDELSNKHGDNKEQLESGLDSVEWSELEILESNFDQVLKKYKFLEILTALKNQANLENTAIFIDSLSDLFDAGKADDIYPIFFEILRPLADKGATLFYLNHTTKDNGSGKKNYAGSHKLKSKTDFFAIMDRAQGVENTLNFEVSQPIGKDRHGEGINFALTYDIKAPLGQRLFKCDFIPDFEAEIKVGADVKTDKQATNLARIKSLFFGKSLDLKLSYGELRTQTGLSDNQLSTILKSDGFLREFEKTRDGYYRRQMIAPSAEVIPD